MILIIGYGNSLRRDDGAGPALANMVKERCGDSDIRVLEVHQLAPELADEIASPNVTAVLFMDASVAQNGPRNQGMPEDIEIRKLDAKVSTPSFGHHFDPSTLLTYAKHLYGKRPQAWLISIPCVDFDYGEGFSKFARRSLTIAQKKVLDLIHRLRVK